MQKLRWSKAGVARGCAPSKGGDDPGSVLSDLPSPPGARRPKLLVVELWGLGDLTFCAHLLRAAEERFEIALLAKPHAAALLQPSFPQIGFVSFDAPWTAFRRKYQLLKWDWRELRRLMLLLRKERFDFAVSVRNDPRDHLLMWLSGVRRRLGFPERGSGAFLTEPVRRTAPKQHKVEDWRDLGKALNLEASLAPGPLLQHTRYRSARIEAALSGISRPILCLHPGARIPVRRWPEENFAEIVQRLREFEFHLILIPDPDGYGSLLAPLADQVLTSLSIAELVDVLGRADLVLCNDSAPGHIAAACGRPAIVLFGPTDPDWFRPWGEEHLVVIRDICPWRPCFDYCKFDQPHCLTKMGADLVWPEIRARVASLLPPASKSSIPSPAPR